MANSKNSKFLMIGIIILVIVMVVKYNKKGKNNFNNGILELSPSNFDKIINSGDYLVVVRYKAPWCGWCKKMDADWKQLAGDYSNNKSVVIADLDADKYKDIGQKEGIEGFPTIKFHKKGKSEKYNGSRDLNSIKTAIEGRIGKR